MSNRRISTLISSLRQIWGLLAELHDLIFDVVMEIGELQMSNRGGLWGVISRQLNMHHGASTNSSIK